MTSSEVDAMAEDSKSQPGETRLEIVLADYLHSVALGSPLDRQVLIDANPDLATDLESFFRNRDAIARISFSIADQRPFEAETVGLSASGVADGTFVRYIGDYELLAEIARGGMGIVYKARQLSLNRIVALKMIRANRIASEEDITRFHAEAEAAANLDHPNITPIFEVGEHTGQPYFSMKLIEGTNLGESLSEFRGDLHRAVTVLAKVARAVHHAHECGVLHRDLKPSNILLDARGEPFVTDFGLAKRLDNDSALTTTGAVVGTPSYMAPEQAVGDASRLSPGVDIYGIGAILYELLTGRAPFRGETVAATLTLVASELPVPPRFIDASVSRELEAICLKCLEKDPTSRYGTASDLADDLERFLSGMRVLARRRIGAISLPWFATSGAVIAAVATVVIAAHIALDDSITRSLVVGSIGACAAWFVCAIAMFIWNEAILPAWLVTKVAHPMAKLTLGLGLVLMSLAALCTAQLVRSYDLYEIDSEVRWSALFVAIAVAIGVVAKVLCLAGTSKSAVQRPLIFGITADALALAMFVVSPAPLAATSDGSIEVSIAALQSLFFYLGAASFGLTIKHIAKEFDEAAVANDANMLLVWMVGVLPGIVLLTWILQTWFEAIAPIGYVCVALTLVVGIVRFAQTVRKLQQRILLRI
jgi:tRNA A-37 threonylcarbamoyl transferase component Bud32